MEPRHGRGEARKGHDPEESRMTQSPTPPPETHPGVRCDECEGWGYFWRFGRMKYCPACHGTGKQMGES